MFVSESRKNLLQAVVALFSHARFKPIARGSAGKSKPQASLMRKWIGRALLLALGWTAVGAFLALPELLSRGGWGELIGKLVDLWLWGLLTPLILAVDRRLPFSDKQLPLRIAAHLPLSLLFSLVHIYATAALVLPISAITWNPWLSLEFLPSWFLGSWVMYWTIFGASQAFRYYRRYLSSELGMERLERRLLEARLNTLRMQLDPHFLFNALNTISSEVRRDPTLAQEMIEDLGVLLRLSLEFKHRQEIPLAEEMVLLEHYLAIQKIRFGDRLKIEIHIAPEVKYASVPCLLIQPLAENAIRHGLSGRSSGGSVIISAERVENRIEIRVLDDGVGLPPGWQIETSAGLGLTVTRERIAGLYPDGTSRFVVRRRTGPGTEVEISLPLRVIGEDTNESASI
jgi:signal transduction histidine kinase